MIPAWVLWVSCVFAVYRVTMFVTLEEGPRLPFTLPPGIMWRIRVAAGAYDYGERNGPDGMPMAKTTLGRAVVCAGCVSPIVAAPAVAAVLSGLFWLQVVIVWLGVSGLVIYVVRQRPWRTL